MKVTLDIYDHWLRETNSSATNRLADLALGEKASKALSSKTVADANVKGGESA